jgi:hypothetical protein
MLKKPRVTEADFSPRRASALPQIELAPCPVALMGWARENEEAGQAISPDRFLY